MNDTPRNNPAPGIHPGGREKRHHCLLNRRAGFDRRQVYSLVYFANGGIERRRAAKRRWKSDRRRLWETRGMPCPVSFD